MIGPFVTTAIEEAKAEGVFRPVLHLIVSGYALSDEEAAAIAALPFNRGRRPSETTAEAHDMQAKFLNAFRAAKQGRGPKAIERALAITLREFPEITENVACAIIEGHRPKISALAKILSNDK